MIRPAKMVDVPALVALLSELHPTTRYAHVPIDPDYARKMLAQMVQRDGHTTVGGSLVRVWEEGETICGFIVGVLDRVYHIGRYLWANDVYLIVQPESDARAMPALLAAYCQWADGNEHVIETRLSWSDATDDGGRMAAVYARMGFTDCGRMYRREVVR